MKIESIVIMLDRFGGKNKPDYSIIIRGDGKVFYEGRKNVGTIGFAEKNISEEKVLSLLSEFKKIDFFSLDKNFVNNNSQEYNSISISLSTDGSNNMKIKKISFSDNAEEVPDSLKELSNKIDKVVNSSEWVNNKKIEKEKKFSKKIKKILNDKNTVILFTSILVVIIILSVSGILYYQKDSFTNVEKSPSVLVLTTASAVRSYKDYDVKTVFERGDTIYIYTEYANIKTVDKNSRCNLSLKISIMCEGEIYYSQILNKTLVGNNSHAWFITTDKNWKIGNYTISLTLLDILTGNSTTAKTFFDLIENTPDILVLTTASNVRGYQDYDIETNFKQGDRIYVYCEYADVTTFEKGNLCNISLSLNVTTDGVLYFSNVVNKTTVGNNTHVWWFTTDSSWMNNTVYTVTLYLMDKSSGKSTISEGHFFIS